MTDDDPEKRSHGHAPPDGATARVAALERLLFSKGLIDPAAVDALVEQYEHRIGPRIGARLVARAWADASYRQRLLENANEALAEFDITRMQGEDVVVLENTEAVHNVVVCTLCSCYPWNLLGLPPPWYKSLSYRSRVVKEPRAVLREDFGLAIAPEREIRVWDSNAELRYLVLPLRPPGTENLGMAELAALVTRDSMIGTGEPHAGAR